MYRLSTTQAYLEPSRTFTMELFCESFRKKASSLDVQLGSQYACIVFTSDCALPSNRLKIFSNLHEPLPQQKVIEQMKVLILTLSLCYALEQNSKTFFVCLAEIVI